MHILLTNDDGIDALGINEFAQALPKEWRITILAPSTQQSGMSHALTLHKPLCLKEHSSLHSNIKRYSLSGTPTDCVKFALDYYLKEDMPDLLISGLNDGFNLGSDALYSGTVGAGMEGVFYHIPSLALSVKSYSSIRGREIFSFVADFIKYIFIEHRFQGFINMNFPLEGPCSWNHVKIAQQGVQQYANVVEHVGTHEDGELYVIAGEVLLETEDERSDVHYMKHNYITANVLTWLQLNTEGQEALATIIAKKIHK